MIDRIADRLQPDIARTLLAGAAWHADTATISVTTPAAAAILRARLQWLMDEVAGQPVTVIETPTGRPAPPPAAGNRPAAAPPPAAPLDFTSWTKVPNSVIEAIADGRLNSADARLLLLVLRNTAGIRPNNTPRTAWTVTHRQLHAMTGASSSTIAAALRRLETGGYISRNRSTITINATGPL